VNNYRFEDQERDGAEKKILLQNFSDIPEDGMSSVPKRVGCVQVLTDKT
jgi:hypothetical protein